MRDYLRVSNNKAKGVIIIIVFSLLLVVFFMWQNNSIIVSEYEYFNSKIPRDFKGFRIVHISDLHNKMFGEDQSKLLIEIERLEPDIIVVTGDLIDRRKFDLEKAMCFIDGTIEIAPVYFVSGNHEAWSGKYPEIKAELLDSGVIVLDDTFVEIIKGSGAIKLFGFADPGFDKGGNRNRKANTENLGKLVNDWSVRADFKVLLTHRPELFDRYIAMDLDMIFAGHAHGGQFRIPLIGAIFAPDQGFFPKFTSGNYEEGSSTMFVSRGLGNSIIPVRIFNRPEIVSVTFN